MFARFAGLRVKGVTFVGHSSGLQVGYMFVHCLEPQLLAFASPELIHLMVIYELVHKFLFIVESRYCCVTFHETPKVSLFLSMCASPKIGGVFIAMDLELRAYTGIWS